MNTPETRDLSAKPDLCPANSMRLNMLGLQPGVNFYDIDWQRVFSELHWSYDGPLSEKVLSFLDEDGTFNVQRARRDEQYGPWLTHYVDAENRPKIDAICAKLEEHRGSVSYVPMFSAIPDPMRLEPGDRERVMNALLGHCEWLMRHDKLSELFSCFEQLFPVWFDSFEILEERLPKGLRRGYIERMPHYMRGGIHGNPYDNMAGVRAVIESEFPQEEWAELLQCAVEHPDAICLSRMFRQRWPNGLPRKSEPDLERQRDMLRGRLLAAGAQAPRLENSSEHHA